MPSTGGYGKKSADPTVVVAIHGDHPAVLFTASSKRNANADAPSTLSAGTKCRTAARGRHGPRSTTASAPSATAEGSASTVRRQDGGITAVTASVGMAETAAKRSVFRRGSASRTSHHGHIDCTFARQTANGLHDLRQMYLGRLHTSRNQGIHRGVPHSPRVDPSGALRQLSGATRQPSGAGDSALPPLRGRSRRLSSRGTGVAPIAGVDGSSDPTNDGPQQEIIYRFSVNRGMAVALVIETPDWYSGLLQSALARVRIEGQN